MADTQPAQQQPQVANITAISKKKKVNLPLSSQQYILCSTHLSMKGEKNQIKQEREKEEEEGGRQ